MPDFTFETYWHCGTCEHFQTQIEGSRGKIYDVTYGPSSGPYEYDWECPCEGFKYYKKCKHIDTVKESGKHCNWNQFIEGGHPDKKDGKYYCPKCGKEAFTQRYAV
jgi:hypothetical protein